MNNPPEPTWEDEPGTKTPPLHNKVPGSAEGDAAAKELDKRNKAVGFDYVREAFWFGNDE